MPDTKDKLNKVLDALRNREKSIAENQGSFVTDNQNPSHNQNIPMSLYDRMLEDERIKQEKEQKE